MNKTITINLNKLIDIYLEEERALFYKYLVGNNSITVINEVIALLVENEFIYYTDDDLISTDLLSTKYHELGEKEFLSLRIQNVLPNELEYTNAMYINFDYEDGTYVNESLGKEYKKRNIPGLFHFNDNIITYYFLDGNEFYLDR